MNIKRYIKIYSNAIHKITEKINLYVISRHEMCKRDNKRNFTFYIIII